MNTLTFRSPASELLEELDIPYRWVEQGLVVTDDPLACARLIFRRLRRRHRRARRVWIDVDPTCTPTYGEQQMTFFNGYYETSCYRPLVLTVLFDDDPRKYPVVILVRPGNSDAMEGLMPLLRRLVPRLRRLWPKARLWLRADAAYARRELFAWLEEARLGYDISMAANAVLNREVEEALPVDWDIAGRQNETTAFYFPLEYKAGTWSHARRVLAKRWRWWSPRARNCAITFTTWSRRTPARRSRGSGGTTAIRIWRTRSRISRKARRLNASVVPVCRPINGALCFRWRRLPWCRGWRPRIAMAASVRKCPLSGCGY